MAESGSGTAGSAAVAADPDIDKTRECAVRLRFTDLGNVDGRGFTLGFAAPTPTTYAGMSITVGPGPLLEQSSTQISSGAGGWSVNGPTKNFSGSDLNLASAGDHLYAALWPTLTPSGAAVPDVLIDLGEIF